MLRARHVRLQAPDRDLVRRGVILLEDALRTATLDQPKSRLVLVRRLDLGVIRTDRSPARLALQIELRMASVSPVAIVDDTPAPVAADAVFFEDRVHAVAQAAIRIARGIPLTEWFWPMAVDGIRHIIEAPEVLSAAIRAALQAVPQQESSRPSARRSIVTAILRDLHRASVLETLVARLTAETATSLLAEIGVAPGPMAEERPRQNKPAFVSGGGEHRVAASRDFHRELRDPTEADPRRILLRIAVTPELRASGIAPQDDGDGGRFVAFPGTGGDDGHAVQTTPALASPPDEQLRKRDPKTPPHAYRPAAGPGPGPQLPMQFAAAVETAAGGVLFLLPVLRRLFPKLYESEMLPSMLDAACERAKVPERDPLRAAIRRAMDCPCTFSRAVLRQCERWLWRNARLNLVLLVRRNAALVATRTHIELLFVNPDADLRIRRLGLDSDPGWVPALSRVILYHYETKEWTRAV